MKKPTKARNKAAKTSARRSGRASLRAEYDFRNGVRGKYAARYARATKLVLLDPDVASAFADAKAVNRALRAYLKQRSGRRSA